MFMNGGAPAARARRRSSLVGNTYSKDTADVVRWDRTSGCIRILQLAQALVGWLEYLKIQSTDLYM